MALKGSLALSGSTPFVLTINLLVAIPSLAKLIMYSAFGGNSNAYLPSAPVTTVLTTLPPCITVTVAPSSGAFPTVILPATGTLFT